jgi:hypothetical protein
VASKTVDVSSRMPVDQARQLLNVEEAAKSGTLTRQMVTEAFEKHYEANDVEKYVLLRSVTHRFPFTAVFFLKT